MKKPKKLPRQIKLTAAQEKAIQKKADFYTEGNFSKWVRYAALHFIPGDREIIKG